VERTFKQSVEDWSYRFTMKAWESVDDRAINKALEDLGEEG
jgi:hypothetical protein